MSKSFDFYLIMMIDMFSDHKTNGGSDKSIRQSHVINGLRKG